MNDEGFIALTVPDKRYCFDRFRARSSLANIVDAHEHKRKIHSVGTAAEYFMSVTSRGGNIAWTPHSDGEYKFVHTVDQAKNAMKAISEQAAYLDLHAWVFTPSSFRLIIEDLYALGLSPFREVSFQDTTINEFYVQLSKSGTGPGIDRMELVKRIDEEEAAAFAISA